MFTVESASNPVYANEEGTCISLNVKFAEFDEFLPFGATPYDPMPYGIDLYNRAIAGEFGEIGEYVPPTTVNPNIPQPTMTGAQTL